MTKGSVKVGKTFGKIHRTLFSTKRNTIAERFDREHLTESLKHERCLDFPKL